VINDPIVEEIHEARRRIFEDCGGNVDGLIARLKAAEQQDKDRLVSMDEVRRRAATPRAAT
jgi:hypothetical protein